MKRKFIYLLLISTILFISCKESSNEPQIQTSKNNYFPLIKGATYSYNIAISDINGVADSGKRITRVFDDSVLDGTNYTSVEDSFSTSLVNKSIESFYREANTGIFLYKDTTGFTQLVLDSLQQNISLDKESRILFYPPNPGQRFPVYKLSINTSTIGINVLDFNAFVESEETINISLNNLSTNLSTLKIRYDFKLRISENEEILFNAFGWIAKDIGFIKWEGDGEVFNFLFGDNIFPADANVLMYLETYQ